MDEQPLIQNNEEIEQNELNNQTDNNNQRHSNISSSSYSSFFRKKLRYSSYFNFICLIIIFIIGYLFQNTLYKISLNIIKNNQQFYINHKTLIKTFKYLSSINFISYIIIFVYIYYPLNISYSYLTIVIFSWYLSSLFDLIYGVYRDWNENDLSEYFNNGSEKISGHCLLSTSAFIGLWEITLNDKMKINNNINNDNDNNNNNKNIFVMFFKKFENKKYIIKYLTLFLILLFLFFLSLISVLAKDHSLNLCFVGIYIGYFLYNILFKFIGIHVLESKQFLKIFKKRTTSLFLLFFYVVSFIIVALLYFSYNKKFNFTEIIKNEENLNDAQKKNFLFNYNALINGTCIFILIGIHFGLEKLEIYIKNNKYYENNKNFYVLNFHNNINLNHKIIIIEVLILSNFIWILHILINEKETAFGIIICLKYILPYFMIGYVCFYYGIVICIKIGVCNINLYKNINEEEEMKNIEENMNNNDEDNNNINNNLEEEDDFENEDYEESENENNNEINNDDNNNKYKNNNNIKQKNDDDLIFVNYSYKM